MPWADETICRGEKKKKTPAVTCFRSFYLVTEKFLLEIFSRGYRLTRRVPMVVLLLRGLNLGKTPIVINTKSENTQ